MTEAAGSFGNSEYNSMPTYNRNILRSGAHGICQLRKGEEGNGRLLQRALAEGRAPKRAGPRDLHYWLTREGASPDVDVSGQEKRPGSEGAEPDRHSLKTRKSINDRPKSLTYGQPCRGKRVWEAPFALPSDEIAQGMPCDGKR